MDSSWKKVAFVVLFTSLLFSIPVAASSLDDLINTIKGLDVSKGIKTSLLAKAENAKKALDNGNTVSAINRLNALKNEINALKGKKISQSDAATLLEQIEKAMQEIQPPTQQPLIFISEIYRSADGSGFVELTVRDDKGIKDINLQGWSLTTFDNDSFALPDITELGNYDYISLHFGAGTSDLDASDGSATVFINAPSPLEPADEVGLSNNAGALVDFVRYNGGNGDAAAAGWAPADPGPTIEVGRSLQIHGLDENNVTNWVSMEPTEANPNIFDFIINTENSQVNIRMRNGASRPIFIAEDAVRGINISVINISPGVSLADLSILQEMMNFSYNFYMSKGFNEPEVGDDGVMQVNVTRNNGFGASTQPNGDIIIDIGGDLSSTTVGSFIKWNIEHEFLHTIQFGRFHANGTSSSNGSFNHDGRTPGGKFAFALDGPSEYFGLEISKKQYNVTEEFIFNASMNISKNYSATFKSIPYNFTSIFGDFDFNLPGFTTGSGIRVYTHGYLFWKYVADTYGEHKLVHIHNVTRNNRSGNANDAIGTTPIETAFREQGINLSFSQLWVNYTIWIYTGTGRQPALTFNSTFHGAKTGDTNSLAPWGTDYERIAINKSNINSSGPYNITFGGAPGVNYSITVLVRNNGGYTSAGSHRFQGSASIPLNTEASEIIIIKTMINNETTGRTDYGFNFSHAGIINSTVKQVQLQNSTLKDSAAENSSIINSNITRSIVNHSTVKSSSEVNSTNTNTNVENSQITNSQKTNSTVNGSMLANATVTGSTLKNVTAINSTIINSTKENAVIINSVDLRSTVKNSKESNATLDGSDVTGSTIENSVVNSTHAEQSTVNNSKVSQSSVNASSMNGAVVNQSSKLQNATLADSVAVNSNKTDVQMSSSANYDSDVTKTIEKNATLRSSRVSSSTVVNGQVNESTLHASSANNSNMSGSNVRGSTLSGSSVAGSNMTNAAVSGSTVGNSQVTGSNVSDSTIKGSTVTGSTLKNVTVINSTIINSTKENAVIINSVDIRSTVTNSIENNSQVNDSTIDKSTVQDSTVENATLTNVTAKNSSVSDTDVQDKTLENEVVTAAKPARGNLVGQVVDGQNSPIAGAQVLLFCISCETSLEFVADTDETGQFAFLDIPAGTYSGIVLTPLASSSFVAEVLPGETAEVVVVLAHYTTPDSGRTGDDTVTVPQ